VHHTHPAAAQLLDDAIMRDGLADHGWQEANEKGNRRAAVDGKSIESNRPRPRTPDLHAD
ncbi:MAG: hypothetical protein WA188_08085, partial [Terriglobales bacterium]